MLNQLIFSIFRDSTSRLGGGRHEGSETTRLHVGGGGEKLHRTSEETFWHQVEPYGPTKLFLCLLESLNHAYAGDLWELGSWMNARMPLGMTRRHLLVTQTRSWYLLMGDMISVSLSLQFHKYGIIAHTLRLCRRHSLRMLPRLDHLPRRTGLQ